MSEFAATESVTVHASERKTRVVHARFSASEIALIEKAAMEAELTVSAFMRSLTLEGAGVKPFFTEADRAILGLLLSDVRALGVNLNRIGRAANRRQDNRSEEERRVIDDVHRVFAALLIELSFFVERGARMRGVKA
jgi:hypothetical protein